MKKYIEVNLKNFHLTLPLIQEYKYKGEELSPNQYKAILETIKKQLQDPELFKQLIQVNKKVIYSEDYILSGELTPGRIVLTEDNEVGIITGIINQKPYNETSTVSIAVAGHRIIYVEPHKLRKIGATFEEVRCIRLDYSREENLWHEGDTGYLEYENAYVPVIIGKSSRGCKEVHEIYNGTNTTAPRKWRIPTLKLSRFVREFKSEEEKKIYASLDEAMENYRYLVEAIANLGDIRNRYTITNNEKIAFLNLILVAMQPSIERSDEYLQIIRSYQKAVKNTEPLVKRKFNSVIAKLEKSASKTNVRSN